MTYVTTSKICENGKRTGFVFMNEKLQTFLVKDDELEKLMQRSDTEFDIVKAGKSFRFKDPSKKISELPTYKENVKRASLNPTKSGAINYYVDEQLEDMIKLTGNRQPVRRECTVKPYLENMSTETICSVSGLSCTGKSTMIKSTLKELELTGSTIWFEVTDKDSNEHVQQLYDAYFKRYKIIVIDKADNLIDLHEANWLVKAVKTGRKVIMITSGDLFYKRYSRSMLKNYIESVYTTPVTFKDYVEMNPNIKNISFIDYTRMGEIRYTNKRDIDNKVNLIEYFDSDYCVIDDILKALMPCEAAKKWFCNGDGDIGTVRIIVTDMLLEIANKIETVTGNAGNRNKKINYSYATQTYDFSTTKCGNQVYIDRLNKHFGTNPGEYTDRDYLEKRIVTALEEMGIMTMVKNSEKAVNKHTIGGCVVVDGVAYFTNPSIVNRLYYDINMFIEESYVPKNMTVESTSKGFINEGAVVYCAKAITNKSEYADVFMYRHDKEEIDLIVRYGQKVDLVEIKSTVRKSHLGLEMFKWIGMDKPEDKIKCISKNTSVKRYIVYNGTVNGSKKLSNGITVEIMNIVDYLNNLEQKVSTLPSRRNTVDIDSVTAISD